MEIFIKQGKVHSTYDQIKNQYKKYVKSMNKMKSVLETNLRNSNYRINIVDRNVEQGR